VLKSHWLDGKRQCQIDHVIVMLVKGMVLYYKNRHNHQFVGLNRKDLTVLWTESTTLNFQSSKSKVPQVNSVIRPARDPEKQGTHAKLSGDLVPRDQNRSKSPDISHVLIHDKSRDQISFGRARSPLINRWQTVGTVCNQRRHMTLVIG
jgi:hypothetical protein